ncbi:ribosomal-processing cysteine protease Prp [Enterococcus sp. DIV1420a]|uniref:ribosomal-processing cysteine protease Prp n=1 Tax=Enterococcus sp. DIV1420a TaxID=2774672 RepID=UPI0036D4D995
MIKATFKKKNHELYWFKVEGHAEFADIGQDIVCAGVSSLYITIVNELKKLGRTFQREGGFFILDASIKELLCLRLLYDGLSAIAKEYPQNVKVKIVEE